MKKKKMMVILIVSIIICLIIFIGLLLHKNYTDDKRYEQIKRDINEDILDYLRVSAPYCEVGSSAGFVITDETLIYVRGMDREKLLDVDKESYCKVRVEAKCVGENEWGWNTYLSCKDYEDEGFINWDK